MTTLTDLSDFQTPEAIAEKNPQFPAETLQWWIRQRNHNGLAEHVRKVGRRIYLYVPGFFDWVNSRSSN